MKINWHDVAEAAYVAYSAATDNKNFRGEEMPPFDRLPPEIQKAWIAAARRAFKLIAKAILA